jgi:hypothetical protein
MPRRDSQRDDYLLRIIRQAADALRRLRERLTASAESAATVREEAASEATSRARASALRAAANKLNAESASHS